MRTIAHALFAALLAVSALACQVLAADPQSAAEARDALEHAFDVDLAGATSVPDTGRDGETIEFTSTSGTVYTYNVTHGYIVRYRPPYSALDTAPTEPCSDEELISIIRPIADRAMSEMADELTWRVEPPHFGDHNISAMVIGTIDYPELEPPREGFSPRASALVWRDGRIASYGQYAPPEEYRVPRTPGVDAERAHEIALEAVAHPDAELRNGPTLSQHLDRFHWTVSLTTPGQRDDAEKWVRGQEPGYVVCTVDAASGEVLSMEWAEGTAHPAGTGRAQPVPYAQAGPGPPRTVEHAETPAQRRRGAVLPISIGVLVLTSIIGALALRRRR